MEERYESSQKAGIIGILGNIFLLIIKGAIGFFTHSQAMIADAANSFGDIFASAMTSIGSKIASAPDVYKRQTYCCFMNLVLKVCY